MRVRLVPVGEIFRRMPFVVRDLARDNGKRVQLDLVGQATEIDKFLIERMMDPVLHLVRNAISHAHRDHRTSGWPPARRPEGTIRLSASTAGESVVLEISDDGRGHRRRGGGGAGTRGRHGDRRRARSTRERCSTSSARRGSPRATRPIARAGAASAWRWSASTVEELGGALAVETRAGRGTTFRITLPLTLAITDAHHRARRRPHVRRAAGGRPRSHRGGGGGAAVDRTQRADHLSRRARCRSSGWRGCSRSPCEARPRFHAIVVGTGLAAVGLLVDRIAGQREIVVKTITRPAASRSTASPERRNWATDGWC